MSLRSPGHPTRIFSIPCSPWDCIAPLSLLLPDLDPCINQAVAAFGSESSGGGGGGGSGAVDDEMQAGARAALVPGDDAAGDAPGDAMEVDGGGGDAAGDGRQKRARREGGAPLVEETPAVERICLAAQNRAFVQQQEDWLKHQGKLKSAAAAAGGGAGGAGGAEQDGRGGQGAAAEEGAEVLPPPVSAYLLGPTEAEAPPEKTPLDQVCALSLPYLSLFTHSPAHTHTNLTQPPTPTNPPPHPHAPTHPRPSSAASTPRPPAASSCASACSPASS